MTKQEWLEAIAPIIVRQAKARGYNFPSAIIAQAICESGWGQSTLASKYHNYFGMKCGSSWKGGSVNMKTQEEYSVGTLTSIRDNFRTYQDMESGVVGYFLFITSPRYGNLRNAESPTDYFSRLKSDGWATSSTYVNTLTSIWKSNGLSKWDNGVTEQEPKGESTGPYSQFSNEELASMVIQGKFGNGSTRKQKLGRRYADVQKIVDMRLSKPTKKRVGVDTIALEVIKGQWGNGKARRDRLEAAGYDYNEVQAMVNKMLE